MNTLKKYELKETKLGIEQKQSYMFTNHSRYYSTREDGTKQSMRIYAIRTKPADNAATSSWVSEALKYKQKLKVGDKMDMVRKARDQQ